MAGFRDDDAEKDVKVVYGEIKIIINHQLYFRDLRCCRTPSPTTVGGYQLEALLKGNKCCCLDLLFGGTVVYEIRLWTKLSPFLHEMILKICKPKIIGFES